LTIIYYNGQFKFSVWLSERLNSVDAFPPNLMPFQVRLSFTGNEASSVGGQYRSRGKSETASREILTDGTRFKSLGEKRRENTNKKCFDISTSLGGLLGQSRKLCSSASVFQVCCVQSWDKRTSGRLKTNCQCTVPITSIRTLSLSYKSCFQRPARLRL
jgi:hypothetical protein